MTGTEQRFCEFFRYHDHHRIPCLPGCEYHANGKSKCISPYEDPDCPYPISREPEEPGLMPEPVKWCPGPGGCRFFIQTSYKCELKLAHQPKEYRSASGEIAFKHGISWSGTFGGRTAMVVGGVLMAAALIYKDPIFSGVFALFGGVIMIAGYFFWRWESTPWGETRKSKSLSRAGFASTAAARAGTTTRRKTEIAGVDDNNKGGEKYCPNFYYSENQRLFCTEACFLWNSRDGRCSSPYLQPECPYPQSRQPEVLAMMPKPVRWCPGPGGCTWFGDLDYTCRLKKERRIHEFYSVHDYSARHRVIGIAVVVVGLCFGITSLIIFTYRYGIPWLGISMLFAGSFIAMIGAAILRGSK